MVENRADGFWKWAARFNAAWSLAERIGTLIAGGGIIGLCNWLGTGWPTALAAGFAFVVGSLLLIEIMEAVLRAVRGSRAVADSLAAMAAVIDDLDAAEWGAIRRFERANTEELPVDDPVIAGLWGKQIILPVIRNGRQERGEDGRLHQFFAMGLSPLAREVLRERGFRRG